MRKAWMVLLVPMAYPLAMWTLGASAQTAGTSLNGTELLGRSLFNQSCRVCHEKPQVTASVYGPSLSKDSLGGQADVMREVIGNGTPRMPGFKFNFGPAQIDAIVAYLKTVPKQP